MSEQVPENTCLQCDKTREEVKDYFNSPCATATGYEVVETLDEWDRHHWRDWSAMELNRMGIHASFYENNKRTNIYDLEFVIMQSICLKEGHVPGRGNDHFEAPEYVCMRCYSDLREADHA